MRKLIKYTNFIKVIRCEKCKYASKHGYEEPCKDCYYYKKSSKFIQKDVGIYANDKVY